MSRKALRNRVVEVESDEKDLGCRPNSQDWLQGQSDELEMGQENDSVVSFKSKSTQRMRDFGKYFSRFSENVITSVETNVEAPKFRIFDMQERAEIGKVLESLKQDQKYQWENLNRKEKSF
jgi:hypothetical protein